MKHSPSWEVKCRSSD